MRNIFFLVILCTAAVAGLSVSTATVKALLSSNITSVKDEGATKIPMNATTTEVGRFKELPSNRTNIDENALYEHASAKQNNQSERAFIYINQKYKKPSLHHYFRLGQAGPEFMRRFSMTQGMFQNTVLPHNIHPCKPEPVHANTYFQEYDIPGRLPDIASYFALPKLYNCNKIYEVATNRVQNFRGDGRSDTRINNYKNFNSYNRKVNQQRDYIELLKSPLLRANVRHTKLKYDSMPMSHFSPINPHDYFKQHQISAQFNPKITALADERTKTNRNNYGFRPFAYPSYQNKRRLQRVEEPDFDKDVVKDEDVARASDKSPDEELLDQYLKAALEDQVSSKEFGGTPNECRYSDCNLQQEKPSFTIGQQKDSKKHDCKCKVMKSESHLPKDRSERERMKCNQTKTNKVSDITYYEEILADEPPKKKNGIDLKLISKLNNSLYN